MRLTPDGDIDEAGTASVAWRPSGLPATHPLYVPMSAVVLVATRWDDACGVT